MWTEQQKVQCVLWFAELKSVTSVQRRIRREWNVDPPSRKSIYEWDRTLRDRGSLISKTGKHPKKNLAEMAVDQVRESFTRSPRKSIRQASRELQIPRSTVHKILRKRLHLRAYKLQLLHQLKPDDCRKRASFCDEMIQRIDENPRYVDSLLFSDEATFHICGKVNRHNCRIWGSQNPYRVIEHERDSPKVNVWLGMHKNGVIGPFFFLEPTVTGLTYLDMLQNFAIPQFPPGLTFQQDGAPPHIHRNVKTFLDVTFPRNWIGRGGPIAWPPRSPDFTPLDFFAWGFIKHVVYMRKVRNLFDLRQRIIGAVQLITPDMLVNTWQEIEYRFGLCRDINGAHVEVH